MGKDVTPYTLEVGLGSDLLSSLGVSISHISSYLPLGMLCLAPIYIICIIYVYMYIYICIYIYTCWTSARMADEAESPSAAAPLGMKNTPRTAFPERSIEEARRILKLIFNLLLDRDSIGAPNTAHRYLPTRRAQLFGKVYYRKVKGHTPFARTLPPNTCLLYTSPSPRDKRQSRMPSSA